MSVSVIDVGQLNDHFEQELLDLTEAVSNQQEFKERLSNYGSSIGEILTKLCQPLSDEQAKKHVTHGKIYEEMRDYTIWIHEFIES